MAGAGGFSEQLHYSSSRPGWKQRPRFARRGT